MFKLVISPNSNAGRNAQRKRQNPASTRPCRYLAPSTAVETAAWTKGKFWLLIGIAPLWICAPRTASALIFYSTADPAYNTAAPGGNLANSGWQYQGSWGSFLGTPIAPQYFITAGHIGGTVGDQFVYAGIAYTATATFVDPDSDLRIWRIAGEFPSFAPLYTNRNEIGASFVVFGRGTQRGAAVEVPGSLGNHTSSLGNQIKGWTWGAFDSVQRWGENGVERIVDGDAPSSSFGDGSHPVGELLTATFDAQGGANEVQLSAGDSGGGIFIKDGGAWRLAGINFAVAGPYNTTNSGRGFQAAIFDEGGLYMGGEGKWVLTPDLPVPQPGAFYANRISSHLDWIKSTLSLAIPPESDPVLQSADAVAGPFADTPGAVVSSQTKTITVPRSSESQFYRLRWTEQSRVTQIRFDGGNLILSYQ